MINNYQLKTALFLCSTLITLAIFGHQLDVFFSLNYLLYLLLFIVLGIFLSIFFIKSIILLSKAKSATAINSVMPFFIYIFSFFVFYLIPATNKFESESLIVAYQKGTQNQALVLFKKDKSFELNFSAVFGYNMWYSGTYNKKGDSLLLDYHRSTPNRIGKKLLIKNGVLTTLDKPIDSNQHFVDFIITKPKKQ